MSQNINPFRAASIPLFVIVTALSAACAKSADNTAKSGDTSSTPVAVNTGDIATTGNATSSTDNTSIIVNGQRLSPETIQQLKQVYPVQVPPGRYWYDPVSGGWGREGQPIAGQMMPNLSLGGPLAANASLGTSGVFINGRQLTPGEKSYIESVCQTPVAPARYWVMANGVGGYEGQAAIFNLAECPGLKQQSSGPHTMSKTYCDPDGSCTSTGILGSITTYRDD